MLVYKATVLILPGKLQVQCLLYILAVTKMCITNAASSILSKMIYFLPFKTLQYSKYPRAPPLQKVLINREIRLGVYRVVDKTGGI